MDLSLSQEQKQVQKLSTTMRQSLEILQMSTQELTSFIKEECKKNPTIEIAETATESSSSCQQSKDKHREYLENIAGQLSLSDHLLQQVPEWNTKNKNILLKLLEFVDERGFFDGDLKNVARSLRANLSCVSEVYETLKTLHPQGIGARNLQEFLVIQLGQQPQTSIAKLAKTIIEKFFEDLKLGKIDFISQRLGIDADKVVAAGRLLARLNFSPMTGFDNNKALSIIPDVKIYKDASVGEWVIDINTDSIPTIRFSRLYKEIVCRQPGLSRSDLKYLKGQAKIGRMLSEAVSRRKETLLKIAQIILKHQINFFEKGPLLMRPLRLGDVAQELGLHVSTVCRAVKYKYFSTPHGLYEVGEFFDSGPNESVAQSAVLAKIKEIIKGAKGKLPDREVAQILQNQGINVARRTVAKYRQMINLPNSRMRIQNSKLSATKYEKEG